MPKAHPSPFALASEALVRDLKRVMTIPPEVLAELATLLNTNRGLKVEDEAELAKIWSKTALPSEVLEGALGVIQLLFKTVASGQSTAETVFSDLQRFCTLKKINGLEERSESIKRLITPLQAYLKRKKVREDEPSELAKRFAEFAEKWRRETAVQSHVHRIVLHPAYQRIIGLGPDAVPLILKELSQRPGHWFWALHAITGEDPATPGATFREAVDAWLNWGRAKGYI